jgi:hypothetical protein
MSGANGLVVHCKQGDQLKEYSLFLTLSVTSLQRESGDASRMHVEVMEEMLLGKMLDQAEKDISLGIDLPLAILCDDRNDMELVGTI